MLKQSRTTLAALLAATALLAGACGSDDDVTLPLDTLETPETDQQHEGPGTSDNDPTNPAAGIAEEGVGGAAAGGAAGESDASVSISNEALSTCLTEAATITTALAAVDASVAAGTPATVSDFLKDPNSFEYFEFTEPATFARTQGDVLPEADCNLETDE